MDVKVYSTPNCGWCNVLKRYLDEKHVRYEEIDVSRDRKAAMEMILKSGQRGVPVMDYKGNIIVGYDKDTIDRLISA